MNQEVYPYAHGPLLDERNTYFYSSYGGVEFLEAWKREREVLIGALPPPEPPSAPRGTHQFPADGAPAIDVGPLLRSLYAAMWHNTYADRVVALPWLERLVQRFEVTKRIFASYGPGLASKGRTNYRHLPLYVRFAEVMELTYQRTSALPYLNALLKCLDTLSALRAGLGAADSARLAWLCGRERQHVAALARELRVS